MIDPRRALAMLLLAACATAVAADPPRRSPAASMQDAGMVDAAIGRLMQRGEADVPGATLLARVRAA